MKLFSILIDPEKEIKRIIRFIQEALKTQYIRNAVIGLSGGIDSTTCYYLLKRVLPEKNIIAVHLPYQKYTSEVCLELKKRVISISIKKPVDEFVKQLGLASNIKDQASRVRLGPPATQASLLALRAGNIMARVRMIILFDLAKKHKALVCGTENKSEHLLGYFTRFGDAASDIEPIKHLYKTQVYQLAEYLKIPREIIDQAPTAGLWPGQADEKEFGFTYKEADQVLSLYFDEKMSTEKIVKMGYPNAKKIIQFVKKNEFKQNTPYTLY